MTKSYQRIIFESHQSLGFDWILLRFSFNLDLNHRLTRFKSCFLTCHILYLYPTIPYDFIPFHLKAYYFLYKVLCTFKATQMYQYLYHHDLCLSFLISRKLHPNGSHNIFIFYSHTSFELFASILFLF